MQGSILKSAALLCLIAAATFSPLGHAENRIDVLVLYLDDATNTRNGRDIDARIASYIEYSNQAYINSEVDIQLRLVGAENFSAAYTYVDSPNLNSLRNNREVQQLRARYGADLVTLLNLRQPVDGGYICGIGYVPQGDGRNGRFYSNANTYGYSLVGVDCGLNTFTHELGHNMSLGHSFAQSSEGGVFNWARGYGVAGTFSTVMAYPQAFGTRNQLQKFSTPLLNNCEGQRCGVEKERNDGADSASNLNLLAEQISEFMPTEIPVDGGDPKACEINSVANNLIADGGFTSINGWSSYFGAARLSQKDIVGDCVESVLAIENRTQYYAGAYYDLSALVAPGKSYKIKADLSLAGTERANVRMVLITNDGSSTDYQYLPAMSATSSEFTSFIEEFALARDAAFESIGLHIYGPAAGVDILVDNISLVEDGDSTPTNPGATFVIDEKFEGNASGWRTYYGGRLFYSRTASEGEFSLLSRERDYWYTGPGFDATSVIEVGVSYNISVDVRASSGQAKERAQIWLYTVDDNGGQWQNVTRDEVNDRQWQNISGDFVINPSGALTQVRIHVFGPSPGAYLRIDNLRVKPQ